MKHVCWQVLGRNEIMPIKLKKCRFIGLYTANKRNAETFSRHQNHLVNQHMTLICGHLFNAQIFIFDWSSMFITIQLSCKRVSPRVRSYIYKTLFQTLKIICSRSEGPFLPRESSGPDSRTLQRFEWVGCFESPWIHLDDITLLSRAMSRIENQCREQYI